MRVAGRLDHIGSMVEWHDKKTIIVSSPKLFERAASRWRTGAFQYPNSDGVIKGVLDLEDSFVSGT